MSETDKDLNSLRKTRGRLEKPNQIPTTGPAENLREKVAEMTDEDEDSAEPA